MKINEKIRILREARMAKNKSEWTIEAMAEKVNMSPSGYRKIESGENQPPADRLEMIASVFGMKSWELQKLDGDITVSATDSGNGCNNQTGVLLGMWVIIKKL